MKKTYFVVLALALAWCMAIFAAPLLASYHPMLASFIYMFFSPICHQLPERSFFLAGHQIAVCARDTGIYLGALLGIVLYPIRQPKVSRWHFLIASLPIAFDGGGQLLGLWTSTNLVRVTTGLLIGIVGTLFLLPKILKLLGKK